MRVRGINRGWPGIHWVRDLITTEAMQFRTHSGDQPISTWCPSERR